MNKRTIRVANRVIGGDAPCFIIAEVGSNHNGDINLAKELIDVAAEAGADAVKFQSIDFEQLYLPHLESLETKELYRQIRLPEEWYHQLYNYADTRKISFLSAPTYFKAVDLLEQIGVKAYKIASPQVVGFLPIVRYIASKKKPIFLSTGYSDYSQMNKAIQCCYQESNYDVIILHCTSQYPTSPEQANLKVMETLGKMFGLPVGFSDHTSGYHVTLAAVALGAVAIEKHFTISRKLKGPDHFFALEPQELKDMIGQIRDVERCLGSGVKMVISDREREFIPQIQMKLIAAEDLPSRTKITRESLAYRRAPYGILCDYEDIILGFETAELIPKDTPLTWDKLKGTPEHHDE